MIPVVLLIPNCEFIGVNTIGYEEKYRYTGTSLKKLKMVLVFFLNKSKKKTNNINCLHKYNMQNGFKNQSLKI